MEGGRVSLRGRGLGMLPPLPEDVRLLDVGENDLTALPALPSVRVLLAGGNFLSVGALERISRHGSSIEALEVDENSLSGPLLPLDRMPRLQFLSLRKNSLSGLTGLSRCAPALRVLLLDGNTVEGRLLLGAEEEEGAGSSAAVGGLWRLAAFSARANRITTLGGVRGHGVAGLVALDLDGNRVASFGALRNCGSLVFASLRCNALREDGIDGETCVLDTVRWVRVDGNALTTLDGVWRVFPSISGLSAAFNRITTLKTPIPPTLHTLDLQGNRLTDASLPMLMHATSLVSLNLCGNAFRAAKPLTRLIAHLPHLQILDTRHNPLTMSMYCSGGDHEDDFPTPTHLKQLHTAIHNPSTILHPTLLPYTHPLFTSHPTKPLPISLHPQINIKSSTTTRDGITSSSSSATATATGSGAVDEIVGGEVGDGSEEGDATISPYFGQLLRECWTEDDDLKLHPPSSSRLAGARLAYRSAILAVSPSPNFLLLDHRRVTAHERKRALQVLRDLSSRSVPPKPKPSTKSHSPPPSKLSPPPPPHHSPPSPPSLSPPRFRKPPPLHRSVPHVAPCNRVKLPLSKTHTKPKPIPKSKPKSRQRSLLPTFSTSSHPPPARATKRGVSWTVGSTATSSSPPPPPPLPPSPPPPPPSPSPPLATVESSPDLAEVIVSDSDDSDTITAEKQFRGTQKWASCISLSSSSTPSSTPPPSPSQPLPPSSPFHATFSTVSSMAPHSQIHPTTESSSKHSSHIASRLEELTASVHHMQSLLTSPSPHASPSFSIDKEDEIEEEGEKTVTKKQKKQKKKKRVKSLSPSPSPRKRREKGSPKRARRKRLTPTPLSPSSRSLSLSPKRRRGKRRLMSKRSRVSLDAIAKKARKQSSSRDVKEKKVVSSPKKDSGGDDVDEKERKEVQSAPAPAMYGGIAESQVMDLATRSLLRLLLNTTSPPRPHSQLPPPSPHSPPPLPISQSHPRFPPPSTPFIPSDDEVEDDDTGGRGSEDVEEGMMTTTMMTSEDHHPIPPHSPPRSLRVNAHLSPPPPSPSPPPLPSPPPSPTRHPSSISIGVDPMTPHPSSPSPPSSPHKKPSGQEKVEEEGEERVRPKDIDVGKRKEDGVGRKDWGRGKVKKVRKKEVDVEGVGDVTGDDTGEFVPSTPLPLLPAPPSVQEEEGEGEGEGVSEYLEEEEGKEDDHDVEEEGKEEKEEEGEKRSEEDGVGSMEDPDGATSFHSFFHTYHIQNPSILHHNSYTSSSSSSTFAIASSRQRRGRYFRPPIPSLPPPRQVLPPSPPRPPSPHRAPPPRSPSPPPPSPPPPPPPSSSSLPIPVQPKPEPKLAPKSFDPPLVRPKPSPLPFSPPPSPSTPSTSLHLPSPPPSHPFKLPLGILEAFQRGMNLGVRRRHGDEEMILEEGEDTEEEEEEEEEEVGEEEEEEGMGTMGLEEKEGSEWLPWSNRLEKQATRLLAESGITPREYLAETPRTGISLRSTFDESGLQSVLPLAKLGGDDDWSVDKKKAGGPERGRKKKVLKKKGKKLKTRTRSKPKPKAKKDDGRGGVRKGTVSSQAKVVMIPRKKKGKKKEKETRVRGAVDIAPRSTAIRNAMREVKMREKEEEAVEAQEEEEEEERERRREKRWERWEDVGRRWAREGRRSLGGREEEEGKRREDASWEDGSREGWEKSLRQWEGEKSGTRERFVTTMTTTSPPLPTPSPTTTTTPLHTSSSTTSPRRSLASAGGLLHTELRAMEKKAAASRAAVQRTARLLQLDPSYFSPHTTDGQHSREDQIREEAKKPPPHSSPSPRPSPSHLPIGADAEATDALLATIDFATSSPPQPSSSPPPPSSPSTSSSSSSSLNRSGFVSAIGSPALQMMSPTTPLPPSPSPRNDFDEIFASLKSTTDRIIGPSKSAAAALRDFAATASDE